MLLSQFNQSPHLWPLIRFLILCHHPQVTSDTLDFQQRILWGQSTQNPPHPWCFLLAIFYPLIPNLLLSYKSPLAQAVLGIKPSLSPLLQNPITVVPIFITVVLSKACLVILNKCCWVRFFFLLTQKGSSSMVEPASEGESRDARSALTSNDVLGTSSHSLSFSEPIFLSVT